MSDRAPTVLIGVGNRDRGDDAAGPIACDLVAGIGSGRPRIVVLESSVVDLSTYWNADDRVVVVDAAEPGGQPGRITEFDALVDRFTAPAALSTHTIDVTGAIELARVLDRMPAALTVVAIEGLSFRFGEPLTPAVQHGVVEFAKGFSRLGASPTARS